MSVVRATGGEIWLGFGRLVACGWRRGSSWAVLDAQLAAEQRLQEGGVVTGFVAAAQKLLTDRYLRESGEVKEQELELRGFLL